MTVFSLVQRDYTMDEWVPVNMSWARSPPCTNPPEQDSQCVSDSTEKNLSLAMSGAHQV